MQIAWVTALTVMVAALAYWAYASLAEEDVWSIGIYTGSSPLHLVPHPSLPAGCAFTAKDVTDARASFVADPFLVRSGSTWLLFFELWNVDERRGEIAYATSTDGTIWRYARRVLVEPFHLSYPQVFEVNSVFYMIPETAEASAVRLYRARRFPDEWEFVSELLSGHFLDASIVHADGRWWLFALQDGKHLTLYSSEQITGPWHAHAQNPIATDSAITRPGGRIINVGQRLFRFSQNGAKTYGHHVTACEIVNLTLDGYREQLVPGVVVGATGTGWNAQGMHHVDAHQIDDSRWLAAVDGKVLRKRFIWRKGVRAILNLMNVGKSRPTAAPSSTHT